MLLQRLVHHRHLSGERCLLHILLSLSDGTLVNVYRRHLCLRVSLRHHEGYDARPRTGIQDACAPLGPRS